jgi:hypothetical protein
MDAFALAISFVALVASAMSVLYVRRQTHASEAVLGLERKRELERGRPDVVARFDRWLSEPIVALFALENMGGQPIDAARVEVVSGDSKLVGFAVDETQPRQREHEFGRLNPGKPVPVEFATLDKDPEHYEPTVKFLATFRIGDDEWHKLLSADLPQHGPMFY